MLLVMQATGQQPLFEDEPTGTTRALVVGIAEYENESIRLRFANRDAEIFALFLRSEMGGKVDSNNILLLTDHFASAANIRIGLRWLLKESQQGDRVIVYFSGHGDVERETDFNDGYLLAWDTPPNNYPGNAIEVDYLNKVLISLSRKGVEPILYTDACRSGNLAGAALNGNTLANQAILRESAGVTKILSCQPEEESLESPDWGGGRGVFSYYLIKGLSGEADRNKDKVVTVGEIQLYLLMNVPPAVAPEEQTPKVDSPNNSQKLSDIIKIDPAILAINEQPPREGFAGLSRGVKSGGLENPNPGVQELTQFFEQALLRRNLLTPSPRAAMDYYRKLEKKLRPRELENFRTRLAAALQDEAQAAINRYLAADSTELARQTMIAETFVYEQYPKFLAAAADLLGEDDWSYNALMAKSWFLEAVNQRLKGLIQNDPKSGAKKALELLEKTRAELDGAAYVHLEMGLDYMLLGDAKNAETHLQKAAELAPTWPIPYARLSELYRQTGQSDRMLEFGAKAVQADPGFFGGYLETGKALEAVGNLLMAEANYRQALWLNMDSYIPFEQLGFLYLKTGQFALADEMMYESDLRKGLQIENFPPFVDSPYSRRDPMSQNLSDIKPFDIRESFYLELIRINPGDVDAYMALGNFYFDAGRFQEADAMYRKVIALSPEHLGANDGLYNIAVKWGNKAAVELFLDALDRIAPGRYAEQRLYAYILWRRYDAREPLYRSLDMLYNLRRHYAAESRWTKVRWLAVERFVKGEVSKNDLAQEMEFLRDNDIHAADYWLSLGLMAGGYADALHCFGEALKNNYPAEAQLHYWMAGRQAEKSEDIWRSQGFYRAEMEAREARLREAEKAAILRPGDLDLAFSHIAALLDNRQYEKALPMLETLQQSGQLDAEWATELARLRLLSGEHTGARDLLEEISRAHVRPDEVPDKWFRVMGLWELLAGQPGEGLDDFQAITNRSYEAPDDYYQQVRLLARQGELEQALDVLQVAWIQGFRYDRVFKYDPWLRVLKEWNEFDAWKTSRAIDWDRYRRATRYQ